MAQQVCPLRHRLAPSIAIPMPAGAFRPKTFFAERVRKKAILTDTSTCKHIAARRTVLPPNDSPLEAAASRSVRVTSQRAASKRCYRPVTLPAESPSSSGNKSGLTQSREGHGEEPVPRNAMPIPGEAIRGGKPRGPTGRESGRTARLALEANPSPTCTPHPCAQTVILSKCDYESTTRWDQRRPDSNQGFICAISCRCSPCLLPFLCSDAATLPCRLRRRTRLP